MSDLREIVLTYVCNKDILDVESVSNEDVESALRDYLVNDDFSCTLDNDVDSLYHLCVMLGMEEDSTCKNKISEIKQYIKFLSRTNHRYSWYYNKFLEMQTENHNDYMGNDNSNIIGSSTD